MKVLCADKAICFGKMFLLTVISFTIIGCASIIKGEIQTISFKSNPSDAKLIVYNVREGSEIINATTPHTATLKRGAGYFKKSRYRVVIERAGYKTEEILIEGAPNGWYIGGNIIFGGLIGWLIVDPATGAMWTLDPEEIDVNLKATEALFQQDEGLKVVFKTNLPDLPEELQTYLRPVNVR